MSKTKEITSSVSGIIFLTIVLVFLSNIRLFPLREDEVTAFFLTLGAFLWLLVVPLLIVKFVFKNPLRDFGWRLPESWPRALTLTLLALALFVPLIFYFSSNPTFKYFYETKGVSVGSFLLVSVLMSSVYYFSEEFLFRGFMFWGAFSENWLSQHLVIGPGFWSVSRRKTDAGIYLFFLRGFHPCLSGAQNQVFYPGLCGSLYYGACFKHNACPCLAGTKGSAQFFYFANA